MVSPRLAAIRKLESALVKLDFVLARIAKAQRSRPLTKTEMTAAKQIVEAVVLGEDAQNLLRGTY